MEIAHIREILEMKMIEEVIKGAMMINVVAVIEKTRIKETIENKNDNSFRKAVLIINTSKINK